MIRLAFAFLLMAAGVAARAEEPVVVDQEMGSGASAYAEKIAKTVHGCTIHSEIGPIDTPLSKDLANFFLDHPDLAAFLVQRHKLAHYRVSMEGERQSWADDGEGTQGLITLASRKEDSRVYYGEGFHDSRLFPRIHASSVIYMDLQAQESPDCWPHISTRFHVYVRLKNRFLAGLVKTVRPFVRKTVVRIFMKAFLVAQKVGQLTAEDTDGIAAEARSFPLISPEDKDALRELMSRLKQARASCAKARGKAGVTPTFSLRLPAAAAIPGSMAPRS